MALREAAVATPRWQDLKYPSEARFIQVADKFPDFDGAMFYDLPGWIRLGWPDEALWRRAARIDERERAKARKEPEPQPWPVARVAWDEIGRLYPDRDGVREDEQDCYRILRYWPDCYGQPIVEVHLRLHQGSPGKGNNLTSITINQINYGAGTHRVPQSVAVDLRYIDTKACNDYIDQFIPREHKTKVFDMLKDMVGGGEISE